MLHYELYWGSFKFIYQCFSIVGKIVESSRLHVESTFRMAAFFCFLPDFKAEKTRCH